MMSSIRTLWSVSTKKHVGFSILLGRNLSVLSRTVVEEAYKDGELRVFIVVGEVSGDSIASRLMKSLKNLSPLPISFSGVGGSLMSKHGLKSVFPIEDISVMGIWELLPHLHKITVRLKETIEAALSFRPHVVVTVDSKGFSFRFLKQLRARYNQQSLGNDAPVHFHYVAPSFWAWKGGELRLRGLADFVDHILCIVPKEEEVLRANGLAATFVGHPILEDTLELTSSLEIKRNCSDFKKNNEILSGATVVSLFPGSRLQEVKRMLLIYKNAMKVLHESFPELVTVVHVAPNRLVENYVNRALCNWPVRAISIPGDCPRLKYETLKASNVALCTSGTVAVEMQIARLPCVVGYRGHFLTELFIRWKAKIRYISLPNILLDSHIIPEALFQDCSSTKLSELLTELIRSDRLREKQIVAAEKVIRLLSPPTRFITNNSADQNDLISPSMLAASTILYHTKP